MLLAQDKGLITGVHGRIGDLGSIPEQYDIAISSSCPQLDYILVDTIKDAENCINHLRENNIGSASFIAIDKMIRQQPQRMAAFTAPRGA